MGVEHLAKRHRNILILEGTSIFHSFVHSFASCSSPDEPSTSSIQFSLVIFVCNIILYADLTENSPLFSALQAQKSSIDLVQRGIERMTSASIGKNTWRMRFSFHDVVAALIDQLRDHLRRVRYQRGNRPQHAFARKPVMSPYLCRSAITNSSDYSLPHNIPSIQYRTPDLRGPAP